MTEEKTVHGGFEFKTWLYAFLIMLALAITVSTSRFLRGPIFNMAFEICVFYIPTAILLIILIRLKTRRT